MKPSTKLLLVSILGLVLVAPPAYPQDQKAQLQQLTVDSLNLRNEFKLYRESMDQKNVETMKVLQEILGRFSALDSSIQKANDSVNSLGNHIKEGDEKAAADLRVTRTALEALKKDFDEGLINMGSQIAGLGSKISNMKPAEQPLPTAADAFSHAYLLMTTGFLDDAIAEFREFPRNYTDPQRVADATFYIGEIQFVQKKYQPALDQFDLVLEKYPNSGRKCLALYRRGQSLVKLEQIPQAKVAFERVSADCPGTQEATLASADLKSLPRAPRGN